MKLDMHFHSTASDGSSNSQQLLLKAQGRGLDFVALTDHDIVSDGFREEAEQYGISSCQSVEISAYNSAHNKSLHLTFYAHTMSQDIKNALKISIENKQKLIEKQIERLNNRGFIINIQEFFDFACQKGRKIEGLNRYDIAKYIFHEKHNTEHAFVLNVNKKMTVKEFYLTFLKKGGEKFETYGIKGGDDEIEIGRCEVFREKVNGILSIAHPNVTFKKGGILEFEKVLPYYVDAGGINAIEINAKANKDWVKAILKAKNKYGLYLTFGSDCHHLDASAENNMYGDHGILGDKNHYIPEEDMGQFFNEYRSILI